MAEGKKKGGKDSKKHAKGKKEAEDRELDYHTSYKRYQEALELVNEQARIQQLHKMSQKNAAAEEQAAAKESISTNKDASSTRQQVRKAAVATTGQRDASALSNFISDLPTNKVLDDPVAAVLSFLILGNSVNRLQPLPKQLNAELV